MMIRIGLIFIGVIVSLLAENFVVITHKDNPITTLNKSEIRSIYLKKRRFWDGTKLLALNLPPNHMLRQNFEKSILQMSASNIEMYWLKQHYKGHRPPYRLESIKSVVLFIKKVKGAIGYIPESLVDSNVKVIYSGNYE